MTKLKWKQVSKNRYQAITGDKFLFEVSFGLGAWDWTKVEPEFPMHGGGPFTTPELAQEACQHWFDLHGHSGASPVRTAVTDERTEHIRAYLIANRVWDMPNSDMAYLVKQIDAANARLAALTETRPTIVCLCGSTRFSDAFQKANLLETLAGNIVLTIGCDMRSDMVIFHDLSDEHRAEIKAQLDELHLRKIDLADEVLVLNVDGYIGESTRRELSYANEQGKRVRFLETKFVPRTEDSNQ